jgi:uncharacterized protein (DUF1919 family)
MILVTNVTADGVVNFSSTVRLTNVEFNIRHIDSKLIVFSSFSDTIEINVNYFISVNTAIVPTLRNVELFVKHSDGGQIIPIEFPKNTLGNFSLIANSCLAWRTYEAFNSEYTSPTIGCLILDDDEYLRFCEHNDTYVKSNMIFSDTKGNFKWKENCGNSRVPQSEHVTSDYPISHHLDIEIHWIHDRPRRLEFTDTSYTFVLEDSRIPDEDFKQKWERRTKRMEGKDKIFLWSASEFFNIHGAWKRKSIIDRFKSLPDRSIFLTEIPEEEYEDDLHIVKYIPQWSEYNQLQRNSGGGTTWGNQQSESEIIKNIIKTKFM